MIRIISCLDIKNNLVVKGISFKKLKIINYPYLLCKKYEFYKTDEIIILDITSNYTKKSLSYKNIKLISKNINIPISIGGGIKNLNKISKLFKLGADRIVLNSSCYNNIVFLKKISNLYGSQALIVSIDIFFKNNFFFTYKNSGFIKTNFKLLDWVIIVKKIGCGEILITSIENDGLKKGYDIKSIIYVKKNIDISIIISGGLGSINDIYYIYKYCNINSFLIASVFHFNYLVPNYFKKYIKLI
ncbi:imidazole glycerol phosphate synthase subunit HisF [Candidatus Carsonella ruddii]|uniref:Imidazole glycerol phosphate synthase subunit HisF n=1 Tax=Carsonella ruddii TaxID=114186 RepID=A0A2K8KDY2_CARRU|nr:HisA/HisF-related TIM barrel protein [Candidatus Carsonella ruddii]ATX33498.1 imidazole glycerol phosphate synthase subunit HisF [Candidatus Carsonella ruddii]